MTPSSERTRRADAGRLAAFAHWCATLDGWRRWLLAGAAGAAAALAMPPVGLVPLLFVAFPVLVWLVDGSGGWRRSFAAGWWFGFGYFVFGLYWIAHALLIEPERFAWLIPFAVCGLPALLGIFTGVACLLQYRLGGRGPARAIVFAVLWAATEWVRGHAFTGFPWNLTGYAWTVSDAMLQVGALIGIYGLSLVTLVAVASAAALADPAAAPVDQGARRRRWALPAAAAAALAALWVGGALRLAGAEVGDVEGVRLRIVQANIPQQLKWDDTQRVANVRRFLEMSAAPPAPGQPAPTHVIWPETAVPFFLNAEPEVLSAIARVAPAGGAVLTGAPRLERARGEATIWNSIMAVDDRGTVVASYDKFHLVPFGEYMPFRSVVGLGKITAGTVDFTPGPGPRTVAVPGVPPFSALVCYEIIFPAAVTADEPEPQWLLNVTNDGWYGRSAGPHQHFQMARVRAVEEGLPLVRAANTGISAVVDPYGRVVESLPLLEAGTIDAPLPRAVEGRTLYARIGDFGFLLLLAFLASTTKLWRRRG